MTERKLRTVEQKLTDDIKEYWLGFPVSRENLDVGISEYMESVIEDYKKNPFNITVYSEDPTPSDSIKKYFSKKPCLSTTVTLITNINTFLLKLKLVTVNQHLLSTWATETAAKRKNEK